MLLLKKEQYPKVEEKLKEVRNNERELLEKNTRRAREELIKDAVSVEITELQANKKYGTMAYHPGANAWRNGRLIQNHGEVYIDLWQWDPKQNAFVNENAWGGITSTRHLPEPVIEIPDDPEWRHPTTEEKKLLKDATEQDFEVILGPNTGSYWIVFETCNMVSGWFDTEEEALGFIRTKGYLHADFSWLQNPDMDL